jgi:hypothetical protein
MYNRGGIRMKTVHEIVFSVDEEGNLTAQVEGIHGKGCDGLLDILDELGLVLSDEKTPDWDRPEPQGRALRPSTAVGAGKAY